MRATEDAAMPLISVVMPVYNVEDYLAWSARSVLDQSYPRFQLVCVDDGSTDGSGALADAIAAADGRVQVVHQANGGLSAARNTGIDHAIGDVVVFLDSDDALRPGALETIAATYAATGFDVLAYGAAAYPPFEASVWLDAVLSPRDARFAAFEPDVLFKEKTHPFAWRTACRRGFLEEQGIRFDEDVVFGEDQVFHFQVYPRSEDTVLIADKLVDYRVRRADSLMATRFSDLDRRAHEHIALLDTILAQWDAAGFLEQWPDELFDWGVDLLLPSLMLADGRDEVAAELRDVWRRRFSEGFLARKAADATVGPVVRFVMELGAAIQRFRLSLAFLSLRRRAYGPAFVLRQAAEASLGRLTGSAARLERRRRAWEAADAEARRKARGSFGSGAGSAPR